MLQEADGTLLVKFPITILAAIRNLSLFTCYLALRPFSPSFLANLLISPSFPANLLVSWLSVPPVSPFQQTYSVIKVTRITYTFTFSSEAKSNRVVTIYIERRMYTKTFTHNTLRFFGAALRCLLTCIIVTAA